MKYLYSGCILFSLALVAAPITHAQVVDSANVSADTVVKAENGRDNITGDSTVVLPRDTSFHLYRMNYWVSGSICLVASVTNVYAIPNVIKAKKDLTDAEIAGLNRNIFTGFDHWALEQDPSKREMNGKISDYMLPAIIVTPGILAFEKNIRKDWLRLLMMYYEMHSVTFSIYNYSFFGPAFQNKYRPLVYYSQIPVAERKPGNYRNSMYSGHTATAVASTFFLVKVYSDYHPEIGNKKYLLYGLAAIPPLVEGYFRVKSLMHFPSDVMMGMAVGIACGILVPEIHRFKSHKVVLGVSGTPVGPGVNMVWNID